MLNNLSFPQRVLKRLNLPPTDLGDQFRRCISSICIVLNLKFQMYQHTFIPSSPLLFRLCLFGDIQVRFYFREVLNSFLNFYLTKFFFVIYLTKGLLQPPYIFYHKGPMMLYLVPMYRSWSSPLSISTKINTKTFHVTSL